MIRSLVIPTLNVVVIGFILTYSSGKHVSLSGSFHNFYLMDL